MPQILAILRKSAKIVAKARPNPCNFGQKSRQNPYNFDHFFLPKISISKSAEGQKKVSISKSAQGKKKAKDIG